jgi:hypothetical protein
MTRRVIWVTWLGLIGCTTVRPLSNAYSGVEAAIGDRCSFGAQQADGSCGLYEVSVAELLTLPEKFHQRNVRVGGYVTLTFEGNTLCEREGPGSCLWLDIEGLRDPGFRKGWAVVEGTFSAENRGHLGCCAGSIERISTLNQWRK